MVDIITRIAKVLSYYLTSEKINHYVHTGSLSGKNGIMWHQWIELSNGNYLDYRAQMWQGKTAPHGIFNPKKVETVKYKSTKKERLKVPDHIFNILTNEW